MHIGDDGSSQSASGLVRASDCVEYVTLLEKSYAVMAENAGRVAGVSVEQRWSQRQASSGINVYYSSCESCCKQAARVSNVECVG